MEDGLGLVNDFAIIIAVVGGALLLFGIGLEFGWQRIRRVGLQVLLIGVTDVTFMLAVGYQVGKSLGWSEREAVSLGAAISISSSAVLAKVLRDSGKLQTTAGRLIMGILVVEDFVAIVLLTLLSGYAASGSVGLGQSGGAGGQGGPLCIVGPALRGSCWRRGSSVSWPGRGPRRRCW